MPHPLSKFVHGKSAARASGAIGSQAPPAKKSPKPADLFQRAQNLKFHSRLEGPSDVFGSEYHESNSTRSLDPDDSRDDLANLGNPDLPVADLNVDYREDGHSPIGKRREAMHRDRFNDADSYPTTTDGLSSRRDSLSAVQEADMLERELLAVQSLRSRSAAKTLKSVEQPDFDPGQQYRKELNQAYMRAEGLRQQQQQQQQQQSTVVVPMPSAHASVPPLVRPASRTTMQPGEVALGPNPPNTASNNYPTATIFPYLTRNAFQGAGFEQQLLPVLPRRDPREQRSMVVEVEGPQETLNDQYPFQQRGQQDLVALGQPESAEHETWFCADEELDYDLETLQTMEFSALQSESFDGNPNSRNPALPVELVSSSLADRLSHFADRGTEEKQEFLASLSLAEWETAGDWFAVQFGETKAKVQACRKQRREIAKDFEALVGERYKGITEETRRLETDLQRMKQSGGDVLTGIPTPKRKR